MTTVFVTGAAGHVGYQLATRVSQAGWKIRALVRSPQQRDEVTRQGWEAVLGDLTQRETMTNGVQGAEFVLHCAATGGPDLSRAQSVNVNGTKTIATLAHEAGVRRFVHISTVSVHGDPLPPHVDEESPLATSDPEPYCATKAQGELALGEVRVRGLETVVLRPGMICNVVRSQWGNEMVERIRTHGWLKDFHPDDVLPWVHTSNLAEMTWLALTHPAAANTTFLAVDRNVALKEIYVPIANALGQPVHVPDRAPQTSECRLGKIAAQLGYKPVRSFEETVEGLVALAKAPRP